MMKKLDELLSDLQIALNEQQPSENVVTKMRTGQATQVLKEVHDHKLTPYEQLILIVICDAETVHTRDIKYLTGVTIVTLQKVLVSLRRKGLIRKVQNGIYTRELNIF